MIEQELFKKIYEKTLAPDIVPISLIDTKIKNPLFEFTIAEDCPKQFLNLTEKDLVLFRTHNMLYTSNLEEFNEHYVKYEQENIIYYRIKHGVLFSNGWICENGNLKCVIRT